MIGYQVDREFLQQTIQRLNQEPYQQEYINWLKTWKN